MSTASVCWPSAGTAPMRISTSENVMGGSTARTGPASVPTSRQRFRSSSCGCSIRSFISFSRAAGTPAAASRLSSSAVSKRRVCSATTASVSARCCTRRMFVANFGCPARSGRPNTSVTSARQPRSFCTPMRIFPSTVGYAS